jgi:hypothetical protein
MDHSIRSYLERQTTEQLDTILHDCLEQKDLWNYEETIRLIFAILWEREKNVDYEMPANMKEGMERFSTGRA